MALHASFGLEISVMVSALYIEGLYIEGLYIEGVFRRSLTWVVQTNIDFMGEVSHFIIDGRKSLLTLVFCPVLECFV